MLKKEKSLFIGNFPVVFKKSESKQTLSKGNFSILKSLFDWYSNL